MIYEPSEDSYLLEKEVRKYSKDRSFLDLGAGSGIQSIAAKESGAKSVLASDITNEVVSHLKKLKIKAIKSDLFDNLSGKFDLISFNPPYLPNDSLEDKESKLITTGGKTGDELTLRFLKQVKPHLSKNGIILLLLSSLTPKDKIKNLLKKLKMKSRIISSQNIFMEKLEIWEITAQ